MAVFVPPVALVLILTKKKNWNKISKVISSAFLAFWSLLWIIALFVPADSIDTEQPTTTQTVTESTTKEILTTIKETTTKEEKTTEKETTEKETTEKETTETKTENVADTSTQDAETIQRVEEKTTVKPISNTTNEQQEQTTQKVIKETTTKKTVTTTKDPDASVIVYRTKTGECYHHENPCGNGTYYEITLAEAKRLGLEPCEKCVLH